MNCSNHPDVPATGICAQCGKGICQTCTVNIAGRYYCTECSKNPIQPVMQQQVAPQPGYTQYQPYGYYAPPVPSNGLCIASMICGIVSLVFFCYGLGFFPGLAAIIMGAIGSKQVKVSAGKQKGGGMGTAGIILGSIAVFLLVILIIIIIAVGTASLGLPGYMDWLNY